MHAINLELLQSYPRNAKFLLNDHAIAFFPASQQHREFKPPGLSYEDDHRGNALAGLVLDDRVEIRFHNAFSAERIRNLWSRALAIPEIANAQLGPCHYQGKQVT